MHMHANTYDLKMLPKLTWIYAVLLALKDQILNYVTKGRACIPNASIHSFLVNFFVMKIRQLRIAYILKIQL